MDDEDEVRDMNLSSRPSREERRRVREREKIERGMERWGPPGTEMHILLHAWDCTIWLLLLLLIAVGTVMQVL